MAERGRREAARVRRGTPHPANRCLGRSSYDASAMRRWHDRTRIIASRRGNHCDRHPGAPRSAAVGPLPYAGGGRARHHLDPRRPRGDARRRHIARAEGKPAAQVLQRRCRARQQRLSRRRGAGRAVLRLAHRPARTQAAVLHHPCGLSRRHRGHRAVLEFVELRAVSLLHGRRHRRGIHRHQFDHPGARAGALSRLDRPRHQRQLLDRRRARRGGLDRAARSRRAGARPGMAVGVPDRRGARARHLSHAAVAAGVAALADDAWPARGGKRGARSRRGRIPRPRSCLRERAVARDPAARAPLDPPGRGREHAVSQSSGSARSWA